MIRQPAGCVDGICLDELVVGQVYEIGTMLSCYLLAEGFAEPVDDATTALIAPWSEMRFSLVPVDPPAFTDSNREVSYTDELSQAADRPARKRPRRDSDAS